MERAGLITLRSLAMFECEELTNMTETDKELEHKKGAQSLCDVTSQKQFEVYGFIRVLTSK
jgi:hypothetical protein